MDRDKRWERVQTAYDALVDGKGEAADDLVQAIKKRYAENETDEFLKPIILNRNGTIQGAFRFMRGGKGGYTWPSLPFYWLLTLCRQTATR